MGEEKVGTLEGRLIYISEQGAVLLERTLN